MTNAYSSLVFCEKVCIYCTLSGLIVERDRRKTSSSNESFLDHVLPTPVLRRIDILRKFTT